MQPKRMDSDPRVLVKFEIRQWYRLANLRYGRYLYDDLARVASVNCQLNPSNTANWSQTFSFDPFGNIQKTGNNGGTSFLPSYNSATNRYSTLPAGTPTYDLLRTRVRGL